jgi:hypothetical protein
MISYRYVDFKDNWEWIQNLPLETYKNDALIVAGDGSLPVSWPQRTFLNAQIQKCYYHLLASILKDPIQNFHVF